MIMNSIFNKMPYKQFNINFTYAMTKRNGKRFTNVQTSIEEYCSVVLAECKHFKDNHSPNVDGLDDLLNIFKRDRILEIFQTAKSNNIQITNIGYRLNLLVEPTTIFLQVARSAYVGGGKTKLFNELTQIEMINNISDDYRIKNVTANYNG